MFCLLKLFKLNRKALLSLVINKMSEQKKSIYNRFQAQQIIKAEKSMYQKRKLKHVIFKKYAPLPIPQVSQANSTSFDTTANTIKPLEIFHYLQIKRKCYAFQLLKQFILFSESSDSASFENEYDETYHFNLQKIQLHLSTMFSVIKRIKQKLLLNAYDKLKKRYFKKKMVYRNREYVNNLMQKISNLIKQQHQQVLQYVFVELIQNMRSCQLKQELQKNISHINTPQIIQYEDKNFKTKQYLPFHSDEQSGILKNDTESFFQSDSRIQIAKDFGIHKFRNQRIETPQKDPQFEEHLPKTRRRIKIFKSQPKKQLVYILSSGRKNSVKITQPNTHIKIPIQTSNVDIVRVSLNNCKKINSKGQNKKQFFDPKRQNQSLFDCSQCDYCQKLRKKDLLIKQLKIPC